MILLCIDTSGPVAGVALMENGVVRYEAMAVNAFTHSQSILPMVEEAYRHTGLTVEQTDYFAVTVGPGSFTGVRIGVSTLKGLAHAGNKPCIAVDALESMAAGVMPFDGVICPIQDARAGQVYGAAFQGETLERLLPDEPIKLEEYLDKVQAFGKNMLFLGDGMPLHRETIAAVLGERAHFAPPHLAFLRPASAAYLAAKSTHEAVSYLELKPLYLRAPQAERQKNLREKGHE
ncbi:MAG: tRNA (adenosine(37)-N6)-threonylcarbamoyltransferase complex dimerization subunit type 1 TsaB [Clostridia bacterium]|nr:tRNA (adenosine(37)-N6)-threonylcarbamoyltransferase complex dimerization subunit type 1 TsaB [Clostridia bacterium]